MTKRKVIWRFDPLLRSNSDELTRKTENLLEYLKSQETKLGRRERNRKQADAERFALAVECLVCNLVQAHAHNALLTIPLSNTVLRGSPRYHPPVYGKHFRELIALLTDLKLIMMVTKGYHVRTWFRREVTTIRPTKRLLKRFPVLAAPDAFTRVDPPEVIVLRDREGNLAEYVDNAQVQRWRREIQHINEHIQNAAILIDVPSNSLDENGFPVDPERRSIRRIFNGDWTQGGRLYTDGAWQTIKRKLRLHAIRIDGESIGNVDFKQFNLRLAYALTKERPPTGDLYDLTGHDAKGPNWASLREGRKRLVNAMFNASRPLTRWPGQTVDERQALAACFPSGTTPRSATNEIKERHRAIAGYFECAKGLSFMRMESDILVATLLALMKRGITALPLHDAVLVQERHAETAKATMERQSKRLVGTTTIPAEIKVRSGAARRSRSQ